MRPMILGFLVLVSFPTMGLAQPIWQLQNSNFPPGVWVVSLSAPTEQVCWAAGHMWPPNSSPYAGYSRTTDGGITWVCDSIPGAENGYLYQILGLDADTAFAAVGGLSSSNRSKGVYKTTDGGATWTKQNAYASSKLGPGEIYFFDTHNGIVIGDPDLETYTTTDGGLNWNRVSMPPAVTNEYTWGGGNSIAGAGNRLWFGTTRRLFSSTDRGYSWSASLPLPVDTLWYFTMAFEDSNTGIYAFDAETAAPVSIYRKTTDGGATWTDISDLIISGIAASCIRHVPGTKDTYVITGWSPSVNAFACTNSAGGDWRVIDYSANYTIAFASQYVGWGTPAGSSGAVYKYVGPSLVLTGGVDRVFVPASYLLAQNYPNPFNPSTTITYELPKSSMVRLTVCDMLGREVSVLVNERRDAGIHEVKFDASGLSSGVYLYRLTAGDFAQTRRLLLLH
jgi:photosystem II stability/assembly factor-like uncharacterized protein